MSHSLPTQNYTQSNIRSPSAGIKGDANDMGSATGTGSQSSSMSSRGHRNPIHHSSGSGASMSHTNYPSHHSEPRTTQTANMNGIPNNYSSSDSQSSTSSNRPSNGNTSSSSSSHTQMRPNATVLEADTEEDDEAFYDLEDNGEIDDSALIEAQITAEVTLTAQKELQAQSQQTQHQQQQQLPQRVFVQKAVDTAINQTKALQKVEEEVLPEPSIANRIPSTGTPSPIPYDRIETTGIKLDPVALATAMGGVSSSVPSSTATTGASSPETPSATTSVLTPTTTSEAKSSREYNQSGPASTTVTSENGMPTQADVANDKASTEAAVALTTSPTRSGGIYQPAKSRQYGASAVGAASGDQDGDAQLSEMELARMKMIVTNLETGERCRIDQVEEAFPEVALAMTLSEGTDVLDGHETSTATTAAGSTTASETDTKEESHKSAGFLGFLSNLFKFGRPSSLRGAGASNSVKTKCTKRASSSSSAALQAPPQLPSQTQPNALVTAAAAAPQILRTQQDLTDLKIVQDMQFHTGPPWTYAWSYCGRFLATAGHDTTLAVWAVNGTPASDEIERRNAAAAAMAAAGRDGIPSPETKAMSGTQAGNYVDMGPEGAVMVNIPASQGGRAIINPTPYLLLSGHRGDVVDLAWSRANFILTASIDRTVRLWHLTRSKCIMLFQHADFVTSIAFHPIEDRYFVSGSFDRKLRVWSIPTNEVVEWVQTPHIITAVAWSPDGRTICAGLYNGRVFVYDVDQLRYRTQLECKNRSGRYSQGKKVTGLQFSPDGRFLLVTTNDSRIRLYRLDDYSMVSKYKGLSNSELQIKATFNQDGTRIICGSEQDQVYIWDVVTDGSHSDAYESFRAHSGPVTVAQFVPRATILAAARGDIEEANKVKQLILTTGSTGEMRFFENRGAPAPL